MHKSVRYGDQVYIEISDLLPLPSTDTRLLSSTGFLEETIFGVKTQDYKKANFRNCIFTIRPSLVDANEDLSALISLRTELSFLSLSKPDTLGEKCLTNEISFKEKQIEQSKENLQALNKKILLEMDGQPLHYGDVILLEHMESGYYLCADSSYHPNNPTLYNLKLQKDITPACYFRLFSYLSASERGLIDYESEMKLVSAHLNTVVTMGEIKNNVDGIGFTEEDDEKEEDPKKPLFPADEIRRGDLLSTFTMIPLAIGTALESSDNNRIKLIEYCCREDLVTFAKRKIIKNGDYVRFQFEDFYLTVSNTIHRQNFDLVEQKTEGYPYNFINSIFQVVKMNQEYEYPKGSEIQSVPKKTDEESEEVGKYYIKHVMSGHYLSIPTERLFKSTDANSDEIDIAEKTPFFHFINSHLNHKGSLTRNSKVSLKAFQGNAVSGQFYLEGEVEKYQILQADMNTKYFIGFKNADDKIKSKLKLIRKLIVGNKAVGSFFKVSPVNDEERKKILELESYAKNLKQFTRLLVCAMKKHPKVTPAIFENELSKMLKNSKNLLSLLEVRDLQTQVMMREFKILDTIERLFSYFIINPNIKSVMDQKRFETKEVIKLLETFSKILMGATKDNEFSTIYIAQYVRLFILCLLEPSPLFEYCKPKQVDRVKEIIVSLLQKVLGEKDLDTFGQFNYYEAKLFARLDAQKDYSTHLLKVMNHFFNNKAPNLQNSVRSNFIHKYIADAAKLKNIFPKITYVDNEQDFEINFTRESFPETTMLSTAPHEVIHYLIWIFKVIASAAKVQSLKFWNIIINYYSQDICGAMLNSQKVAPKLKNSILAVVENVHSAYTKLPFNTLPPKIQILLAPKDMDAWLEKFQGQIQDAEGTLISAEERSVVKLSRRTSSEGFDVIDINKLSLDLLKGGLEQLQNGNFKSLPFTLQVMKNQLGQDEVKDENLCTIHHSLGMLIHNLSDELSGENKGDYYNACIKHIDKIFRLLLKVDQHVGKRAFKESIWQIKDRTLKNYMSSLKEGEVSLKQQMSPEKGEGKGVRAHLDAILKEWKSKEKLYQLSDNKYETMYLEESLMKDLWKIVEREENEITNAIIELIKEKTNFESNVRKQLFECAIVAEEKEISNFEQLTSSLLTLNKIQRRIQLRTEFELPEKESESSLNEIIEQLENIFLIIYDYEMHLEDEEQDLNTDSAKDIFLQRFRYSKVKAKSELPFKYKDRCIKTFYQKILNVLDAHKILVPFINYLVSKEAFEKINEDKFKLGYCLVMVIMILFMHKSSANQDLLSHYRDFIITFYDGDVEKSSIESIFMFTEMIQDNKKLLKLEADYLFSVIAYTFIDFYSNFDSHSHTPSVPNFIRSLPIIYSCQIPKDMFDSAQFMINTFFNFSNSLNVDNKLSLLNLINEKTAENDSNKDLTDVVMLTEVVDSPKSVLDMPISYTILKELLESQQAFALTEQKESVLMLQSNFSLERVLPFLKNENIEFNFELKQLALQTLENIFFKNIYRNTNIFLDYDHFISFISVLLIDIYGYLKYRVESDDEVFDIFKMGLFKAPFCVEFFAKYDKLLAADLDSIVFLQYQSLVVFNNIWKNYIYYIVCDLFGNILSHFKDFMLLSKDKGQKYSNIFEIWFRLVLKIRSTDFDHTSRAQLDEALKNAVIHTEYAHKRELVYSTLESSIRRTGSYKVDQVEQRTSYNTEIDSLLVRWLGDSTDGTIRSTENNLSHIISTLGFNKPVIKRLIDILFLPETPVKDTLLILKLLRKLIEVENKTEANQDQPIYLWSDVSENEFINIHHVQKELVELDIVKAIFALFYQYQVDKVVVKEILLLCIALLYGGNEAVQDAFYEEFKEDFDNEILSNFTQILEGILELLRVKESKSTQESYNKALQFIFNYLIDHPTSSAAITDGTISVPEELKEKLALGYQSEALGKKTTQPEDYELLQIFFEFLQTLCEGHYLNFQDFLRDQTLVDHSKSSNIPAFLIHAYHIYFKHININNVEIGIKILDLLIEIQQGESKANSEVLLQKTFINDLCATLIGFNTNLDLLARGFGFDSGHLRFTAIKSKVLTLLKDLVERSDVDQLKQISQYVSLKALVSTFKENIIAFHKKKGTYPHRKDLTEADIWDPNLSTAFTVYFILKYLSADEPDEFTPEIQAALKQILENGQGISSELANKYLNHFFKKYTGSVEIFEKRLNKLMRIYFPISVVYSYIKQDTKTEFENTVDRSSSQAKIADFMDASTELIGLTFVEYNSRNRLFGLNIYNIYIWLRLLTNIFAVIVVLFDILHLEYIEENVVYKHEGDVRMQYLLCCIQTTLGVALLLLWIETRLGKALAIKWDEFVRDNVKEKGQLPLDIEKKLNEKEPLTEEIGEAVLLLKGPYSDEWKKVESIMANRLRFYNLIFMFKSGAFLWHLAYVAICIGSNFHPLIAAFQLFDIIIRSDTVNRIVLAVARNLSQFMWTLILLVVIVYVYSLLGMYFFHSRYDAGEDGDMCIDAFSCYLGSLNFGMRSGGGIADVLKKIDYNPEEKGTYLLHTLYDLSFFIIVLTILLDLIFGMIVDAFGDLRDEKRSNDEDMENVCFICGFNRSEYERTSDFEIHTSEEHNMWTYLAYLIYLSEKAREFVTDLTDIEDFVLDRYKKRDYVWIPIGRSLTIERHYAKEQKENKSEIEIVKEELLNAIAELREQNKGLIMKIQTVSSSSNIDHLQSTKRDITLQSSRGFKSFAYSGTQNF